MNTIKHEFALYCAELSRCVAVVSDKAEWYKDDEVLSHRLSKVLRLVPGDEIILFDRSIHAHCRILALQGKRRVLFQLLTKRINNILAPHITCLLPLLKRDDLELALYLLAELAVNEIQLVVTEKSVRSWGKEKEYERLERIVIAAAEQSKYFAMPIIHSPLLLNEVCATAKKNDCAKIYFDYEGEPLVHQLNRGVQQKVSAYMFLVGPEGDLTVDEKNMLQRSGFVFCRLTSTTLRAVHALCVGVGAFRSL